MLISYLSEVEPKESEEGSIDPLETCLIADAMAVKLAHWQSVKAAGSAVFTYIVVALCVTSEYYDLPPEEASEKLGKSSKVL